MRLGCVNGKACVLPSLLLISGIVCGAAEADLYDPSPFTGPYIGLQAGYGITEVEVDFDIGGVEGTGDEDEGGFNGGVYGGYSGVTGQLFGGVELEASLSSAEFEDTSGGISSILDQEFSLGASALVGFLPQRDLLLYGRLGYVYTEVEARVSDGINSASEDEGFHGIRVGAGVDFAFSEHVSARAEYTYTDYEGRRFSSGADSVSFSPWEHLTRAGIAYRF